ncbi:MAG: hypothetical protein K1X88_06590 [Nannocystaceae bacterium]|nr:hypothetical protein [Nannocystaceae bacterium]
MNRPRFEPQGYVPTDRDAAADRRDGLDDEAPTWPALPLPEPDCDAEASTVRLLFDPELERERAIWRAMVAAHTRAGHWPQ